MMPRELLPDAHWLAFAEAAARYLFLNWAFQASLILLVALMVARLPRLRSGFRHGVLLGTLIVSAALPLALLLPVRHAQIAGRASTIGPARHARKTPSPASPTGAKSTAGKAQESLPLAAFPGLALAAGWLMLLSLRLGRVALGFWTVRRWGWRSTPVNRHLLYDACRCQVADLVVAEAEGVQAPTVTGVLQPRILLPVGLATALSRSGLRHVLLHEEAHVRRRDPLWFFVAELALAVVGWHPLAEPVRRAVTRAAEDACDARVLASGVGGPEYARTLLAVIERSAPTRPLAATCPLGSPGGELRRRVSQILYGVPTASRLTAALAGAALALAGGGALALEIGTRPSLPASKASVVLSSPEISQPAPRLVPDRKTAKRTRPISNAPTSGSPWDPRKSAALGTGLPDLERSTTSDAKLADERPSRPRDGRTVVFLLDVSTSMRPYQDEARAGILQQIEQLRPADQFNVLAFSSEVSRFAELPVAPGEDSLAAVRAWVSGLPEHAGSNLGAGITQALETYGLTSLVIYSDGAASAGIVDPAGLGALVAGKNRSHAQVFTVAFGVPAGAGSELFPGAARFAPPPAGVQADVRPDRDLQP